MNRWMTISALLLAGAVTSTGWASAAQNDTQGATPKTAPRTAGFGMTALSASDRTFMVHAARGGMAEVKLGKLAAERASNDAVKQFGQRMVEDHGKANQQLTQLASQKGVALPKEIGDDHEAMVVRLSRLSGSAFDRAYMSAMVKDHKKDVASFEKEAAQGKDADLKSWAAKTLPTLREHLQMAQTLHQQVAGGNAAPASNSAGSRK